MVVVGTPAVAICTLLLVVSLFKTADNSRQAQITMAQVQAYAQKINALEWQVMAERRLDPETLAELQSAKAELRAAVSRLPSRTQPGRIIQEFMPALAVQHAGHVLGRITLSIGISAFPGHGATAEELLRTADQALYRAKREGRDRVVVA